MKNTRKKVYIICRYDSFKKRILCEIEKVPSLNWIIVDTLDQAEVVLGFDSIIDRKNLENKIYILIRHEPESVLPELYKIPNLQKPDLIIDVGRKAYDSDVQIPPPQIINVEFVPGLNRITDRTVMINSDLFSFHKQELYSLRKKIILNFSYVDLYGKGWNSRFYIKLKTILIQMNRTDIKKEFNLSKILNFFRRAPNYKGPLEFKSVALSKYNTSLIIENEKTYVSEKIFDCLNAGTIPIYIGGDLSNYKFPVDLVLESNSDLEAINKNFEFSKTIDRKNWENRLISILRDKEFINYWSFESFLLKIKREITFLHQ